MFENLKKFFAEPEAAQPAQLDPKLAAAALFVHLVWVDGIVKPAEKTMLEKVLTEHYKLSQSELKILLENAKRQDDDAVDFYRFATVLKGLPEAERSEIIGMMWDIVFADGVNHELEDNMVWRIAELIGVATRERTMLRAERRAAAGI